MTDTTPPTTTEAGSNAAEILLNLENLIKNHITSIDKLKEETKKHSQMLTDIFENDATYKEHSNKVKDANKIRLNTRAQLMKQSSAMALSEKVKTMKSDLKELEVALSDYLQEFARQSGTTQIEGNDGEVREIVYTAKLIKLASREGNKKR